MCLWVQRKICSVKLDERCWCFPYQFYEWYAFIRKDDSISFHQSIRSLYLVCFLWRHYSDSLLKTPSGDDKLSSLPENW